MAGLLDPGNAGALRSTAFGLGRHDHLRRRDRDGGPAGPSRGRRPSAGAGGRGRRGRRGRAALRGWDLVGMFAHLTRAEAAATVAITSMTRGFAPTVTAALALADAHALPRVDLLHGMVNAAADGTAGDLALAAAVLAVAKAESHPLLGDIASGRLHVDQVPASAMPGGPSPQRRLRDHRPGHRTQGRHHLPAVRPGHHQPVPAQRGRRTSCGTRSTTRRRRVRRCSSWTRHSWSSRPTGPRGPPAVPAVRDERRAAHRPGPADRGGVGRPRPAGDAGGEPGSTEPRPTR